MSLRKFAGLLAALGIAGGLIGGGVGAAFTDSVTAQQNIDVGTFACKIVDATPLAASNGIATDGKSLTFTSPTIMSSAAGSAPFSFTVKNTGSIPQSLTASASWAGTLPGEFTSILPVPTAPVALASGATHVYDAGIQWSPLGVNDLGKSGSITYTVSCGEVPPVVPGGPLGFFDLNSTNADNLADTTPGRVGDGIGPNVTAVDNGGGSITLTFSPGSQTGYQSCFEYAINGNAPEQRLVASVGPPIVYRTNYLATLTDGMWPFKCVGDGAPATDSVTVNVGVGGHVQVRMSFGAEADYRFDWTQFNAS